MSAPASQALSPQERALLLKIARCPLIPAAISDAGHPCHQVAEVQARPGSRRQVPEGCTDEHIAEYLGRRFDQAVVPRPFTRDGRHLQLDGHYAANPTHFWASVRNRATEVLGPGAEPSRNYVMTEVVHCKSKGEYGVASAAATCADRYLREIFSLTSAPVVVVVGKRTHAMLKLRFRDLPQPPYIHPVELGGRLRELVFIWHPASRKSGKTIAGLYGAECLDQLRELTAQLRVVIARRATPGRA